MSDESGDGSSESHDESLEVDQRFRSMMARAKLKMADGSKSKEDGHGNSSKGDKERGNKKTDAEKERKEYYSSIKKYNR